MKIKVISHDITDKSHVIDLRIEQEMEPYNSISQYIEFEKNEIKDLSNDEIYTKAFQLIKMRALEVFNKVGYESEDFVAVGFNITDSRANSILIVGMSNIIKEKGREYKARYSANILDQYGNFMLSTEVNLNSEYEGLSMTNGELTIESYVGEAKIVANFESINTEMILNITEKEIVLTEQEILMNAVAELYEMIGGTN